jgi:hypothetical protein
MHRQRYMALHKWLDAVLIMREVTTHSNLTPTDANCCQLTLTL